MVTIGMNEAETRFFEAAIAKGYTDIARSGWPDFMVRLPSGKLIAVEVKSINDRVSERQAAIFSLLEEVGLPVFVWWTEKPGTLAPWRWLARSQMQRIERHMHIRPSFRAGGGA